MPDDLRTRIAEAIRRAAFDCPGDNCELSDQECNGQHPIEVEVLHFGQVASVYGDVDALADVVMTVVQPELVRRDSDLAVGREAFKEACAKRDGHFQQFLWGELTERRKERDRYRAAWKSSRHRAAAASGTLDGERSNLEQAQAALARVRAYCTLLAEGSCRVAARETAMDVLKVLDETGESVGESAGQQAGQRLGDALYDQHVRAIMDRTVPEDAMRALDTPTPKET